MIVHVRSARENLAVSPNRKPPAVHRRTLAVSAMSPWATRAILSVRSVAECQPLEADVTRVESIASRVLPVDLADHAVHADHVDRADLVAHADRFVIPSVVLCAILAAPQFVIRPPVYLKAIVDHAEHQHQTVCHALIPARQASHRHAATCVHPMLPVDHASRFISNPIWTLFSLSCKNRSANRPTQPLP